MTTQNSGVTLSELLQQNYKDAINLYEHAKEKYIRLQTAYEASQAYIKDLKREIEILRRFGNKDCTAIADTYLESNQNDE